MKWVLLVFLALITAVLRLSSPSAGAVPGAELVISLGFIILFSFLIGKLVLKIALPMITGYLFAGIFAGPQLSALITQEAALKLHLIDQIALGIIALTAGGELRLSVLRAQLKSLMLVTLFQSLAVFLAVGAGLFLFRTGIGFPSGASGDGVLVMILFIATSAVATSPATTIAVITETHARGPMTQRIIGVTIAKDVLVLLLIPGVIAISKIFILREGTGGGGEILGVFLNVIFSIALGVVIGWLVIAFLRFKTRDKAIFVLGVVFAISALAEAIHIELVLVCVVAGFVVENFSSYGEDLIRSIEESSLPIYVIFFSIAGATLDLQVLQQFWKMALMVVMLRLVATFAGSFLGSRMADDAPRVRRNIWTGFIGQAGITLGLANIIGDVFADSFGPFLKTVIIATIVVNQILGPVIFRIGLKGVDEIGKKQLRRGG